MQNIFIQLILPIIMVYKYWALFGITFLSSIILPIPSGTFLLASAAFASTGFFNIYKVILIVILANISGDNISYWISRKYGEKFFSKIRFLRKIMSESNFQKFQTGIQKHPGLIIFISRFEVISTITLNTICGVSRVRYNKFFIFEVLGAISSVLFYGLIGYYFGSNWVAIDRTLGNLSLVFFAIVILVITLFWRKILHKLNQD